jgi:hypothetical protein
MSIQVVLLLCVVLVYVALTARAAFAGPGSRPLRAGLASLRLLLLGLLLALFLRPSCTMQRLAPPPGPPVVLLDHSQSMQLFGAGQLWDTVLSSVTQRANTPVYLFGDSLRKLENGQTPRFDDTRSTLPERGPAAVQHAQRLVIVSDGAWSNARLPRDLVADREVHYLSLAQQRREPWISLESLAERVESRQNDTVSLRVALTARSDSALTVTVRCVRAGRQVALRRAQLKPGHSRDTVSLSLPSERPGAALCRVSAEAGTLASTAHAVHIVIPQTLTATVYAAKPRLDTRFMGRAVRLSDQWHMVSAADSTNRPHLAILFDWDSTAATLARRVAPGGVILFAGALPCGGESLRNINQCDMVPLPRAGGPLFGHAAFPVPLPTRMQVCDASSVLAERVLNLRVRIGHDQIDTLPLLTTGRWNSRTAIAVTATGFWRWDFGAAQEFGPVEHPGAGPFSAAVLRLAREFLVANLTNTLVVFPRESPVYSSRPLQLTALFPADDDWETSSAFTCSIVDSAGDTLADTAVSVPGGTARLDLRFGALPPGAHLCRAQIRRTGATLAFSDTLLVEPDRSEQFIDGQNTHVLAQFGRSLSADSASLRQALRADTTGAPRRTQPVTVRVEPTWQLLALILLLFCVEWAVRRVKALD